MGVRFDHSLVVGVSARPWSSWPRLMRGYRMAFYTFAVNHRESSLFARRRGWLEAGEQEDGSPIRATQ